MAELVDKTPDDSTIASETHKSAVEGSPKTETEVEAGKDDVEEEKEAEKVEAEEAEKQESKEEKEQDVSEVDDDKDIDTTKKRSREVTPDAEEDKTGSEPSIKRIKEGEESTGSSPVPEKPKFVFGSNQKFSFGSSTGFSMFGSFTGKSVFDKPKAEETKEEAKEDNKEEDSKKLEKDSSKNKEEAKEESSGGESKPISVFGSKAKFANSFQDSINVKSIFEKSTSTDEDTKDKGPEEESSNNNEPTSSEVYKAVHLEKQSVKSGEEGEECLFQVKAKLYNLDLTNISEGWKERGVGILKVNKHSSTTEDDDSHYKARLVMRQEGNFKLILNIPIVRDFKIYKGMVSSMNSDKFMRFQVIENGKPTQYALKIGMIENSSKLFDIITSVIP